MIPVKTSVTSSGRAGLTRVSLAGVGGLMRVLAARRAAEADGATPDWRPGARGLAGVCLLFVAAGGAVWSSLDRTVGGVLRIEQHNRQGAWAGVLREAARLPPAGYGARVNCLVNRALFTAGGCCTTCSPSRRSPAAWSWCPTT